MGEYRLSFDIALVIPGHESKFSTSGTTIDSISWHFFFTPNNLGGNSPPIPPLEYLAPGECLSMSLAALTCSHTTYSLRPCTEDRGLVAEVRFHRPLLLDIVIGTVIFPVPPGVLPPKVQSHASRQD